MRPPHSTGLKWCSIEILPRKSYFLVLCCLAKNLWMNRARQATLRYAANCFFFKVDIKYLKSLPRCLNTPFKTCLGANEASFRTFNPASPEHILHGLCISLTSSSSRQTRAVFSRRKRVVLIVRKNYPDVQSCLITSRNSMIIQSHQESWINSN